MNKISKFTTMNKYRVNRYMNVNILEVIFKNTKKILIFISFLSILLIPISSFSQTSPDCSAITISSSTNTGVNLVSTYLESDGIRNGTDYYGSTIYYPQNTTSILASIIIVPGYLNFESSMQNWGPFLASHGIVCMTIGTNNIFDLVNDRKEALQDALISLKAENTRVNSPLFNKLNTSRVALAGWSMGGGGAQLAAVEDSTIKAIIALCPWIDPMQISVNSLIHDVPVLFFSGQFDAVAPSSTHANIHYNYTPSTTDKLIYEISSGGHTVANVPSGGQGEVGRMALSWLKKYLIEDYCYCPLLLDTPLTASIYQTNVTCSTYGCTDSIALNYDPLATTDDGTCIYCVYGCTDSTSVNYAPLAICDDGTCIASVYGCTNATACNYYAGANINDGSCEWTSCNPTSCGASAITGLGVTNVIHDRVTLTFDNMNTYDTSGAQICRVDQLRIKYREVGASTWDQKNMAAPTGYDLTTGICNSTQNTDKLVLGLSGSTTYEWEMRVWYCVTGATAWVVGPDFTTADNCPNIGSFTAYGSNPIRATFDWDDSNGSYEFVRIKMRVDSISNPQGTDWIQVGGFGVTYGTLTKDKNGLVAGQAYRAQARTWCDHNGGAYNSLAWTALATWTQPTSVRLEGGTSINKLFIYPNPSRDIFNVSFTSDTKQNLKIRILNVIGEELINENVEQFIGEYTKQINLSNNAKEIYLLE
ncbi:MAG: dienelactone hydrolase, partial [Thalassomonas sp.]